MTRTTASREEIEHAEALQRARHGGYEEGRRDALGIHATIAAPFEFSGSWAASMLAQEQHQLRLVNEAMRDLRSAEERLEHAERTRQRRTEEWNDADESAEGWRSTLRLVFNPEKHDAIRAGERMREAEAVLDRRRDRKRQLEEQLAALREAVDAEITDDHPLRRQVLAARRTGHVKGRAYDSLAEYLAQDPRRAMAYEPERIGGDGPYGFRWQLENAERPWFGASQYAIFFHPELGEVCAASDDAHAAHPVYILGRASSSKALNAAIGGYEVERMNERNSLLWAAEQIAAGRALERDSS